MKCQNCSRRATIHLTEIVNGEKSERHLCELCAQKEGITAKSQAPIGELLSNLAQAQKEVDELSQLRCDQCGLRWSEFRKGGLLGCPNDYIIFSQPLEKLIGRAQEGHHKHHGRIPKQSQEHFDQQLHLLRLRQDLYQAVDKEDFKQAIHLRDEIRKFERSSPPQ